MEEIKSGFGSFSVDDLHKALGFYRDVMGFEVHEDMGILNVQYSSNGHFIVYPKEDHIPAEFTVYNFEVNDIDRVVDELADKGVHFEQYTGDIQTDSKGIARGRADGRGPDIAWFKDPAGNILSLMEM